MPSGSFPNLDVRMRGFSERSLVADALQYVDDHTCPLSPEVIPIDQAHGRVLADNALAPIDVPSFRRSAMDGYALKGAETAGAGAYHPLTFAIVGESLPGRAFEGALDAGQAVRIMTGAPVPDGADAVVPAEYATESEGQVEITTSVAPQKHVAPVGEDVTAGSTVALAGRRLRPQDIGLLASVGCETLPVVRQPQVKVIATGNEIVSPGSPRGAHQIYDANTTMLKALVERDGGITSDCQTIVDDRQQIRDALRVPGGDLIIMTGGSSVGAEDHAPTVLAELGTLAIHGIAMRPSSPTGLGRIDSRPVFLLPGNPVSCLCAYDFFAGRTIRRLGGRGVDWPYATLAATVGRKIVSAVGRVDYVRVRLVDESVEPLAVSGASILSSTTRADGFVIVPAACEGFAPGSEVTVYRYEPVA